MIAMKKPFGDRLLKILIPLLQASRTLLFSILKPFSNETKRVILGIFVFGIIRRFWNILPELSNFTIVSPVDGNMVKFRPAILHDSLFVIANQDHEPFVKEVFQPKKGDVVVDVGAHIGLYTLSAAKEVGTSGKVVAIEPDPKNFKLLKENIKRNNYTNVLAIDAALSDSVGPRTFYCATDPSLSGFQPSGPTKVRYSWQTNTLTLTELLKNLKISEIDWLKIDVEGEELKVIVGGIPFLKETERTKIILEISSNQEEVLALLAELGFTTSRLSDIYFFSRKI